MTDKMREEFESWAGGYGWNLKRLARSDDYSSVSTENAWLVWQTAYAAGQLAEREECAKVCEETIHARQGYTYAEECAAAIRARDEK